jgi:type IX secretion system PorP/SprF family membrane protein
MWKIIRYFMPDFKILKLSILIIMKKYLLFIIAFVYLSVSHLDTYAQQEAQFSHNMFNILSYNPAFAGSNDQICANIFARQQWMGFSETNPDGDSYSVSPQTLLFSIDGSIKAIRGGLGAVVYKDKLGHEDNIGVKFGYAYRRAMGPGQASIGIMAGFLNKTINYGGFFPIDAGDPLLSGATESDMIFDVSGGIFYKVPGEYYAGISSTQLIQSESSFPSPLASPKLKRHYFIVGGYQYTIPSAPEFELMPSVLIKTDFVSAQYDVSCLVMWNSQFYGGLSYRPVDALIFLAGARMDIGEGNGGMGIAYDFTTSAMGSQGRSFGSAEIYLNYCFEIKYTPPVSSYKNVRFL